MWCLRVTLVAYKWQQAEGGQMTVRMHPASFLPSYVPPSFLAQLNVPDVALVRVRFSPHSLRRHVQECTDECSRFCHCVFQFANGSKI